MPPKIAVLSLWVFVTLLMAGGLMGFLKAGSKISLITSAIFALLISLCVTGVISPFYITYILIGLLVVVFGIRFSKSHKFMPSGLMLVLSLAELAVLLLAR